MHAIPYIMGMDTIYTTEMERSKQVTKPPLPPPPRDLTGGDNVNQPTDKNNTLSAKQLFTIYIATVLLWIMLDIASIIIFDRDIFYVATNSANLFLDGIIWCGLIWIFLRK